MKLWLLRIKFKAESNYAGRRGSWEAAAPEGPDESSLVESRLVWFEIAPPLN